MDGGGVGNSAGLVLLGALCLGAEVSLAWRPDMEQPGMERVARSSRCDWVEPGGLG